MLSIIFLGLLVFFTALLYWQFMGYPLLMGFIYTYHRGLPGKDYSYQPFISIVVPTYNEEKCIKLRIENLLAQDYPVDRYEVIVVDSGSTDRTLETAKSYEAVNPNVVVLDEGERKGKASAINFGSSRAKGDIILVTDANTVFREIVLKEIAPHFKNPKVGAAGGRFVPSNVDNKLVRASSFYWNLESLMRRGESVSGSACLFHGEVNAWRKNVVELDKRSLSEDLDMAIQIRRQGHKIDYEPCAIAFEAGPTTVREQCVQKKRAAIGTIQCFFKHKRYLWFPRDRYSGVVFPSHKSLQIFSPFLLIGALAALVTTLALREYSMAAMFVLVTGVFVTVSGIVLNLMISRVNTETGYAPSALSLSRIPGLVYYVLLHEVIILLAWVDYILGRYSVNWQKAETTRICGDKIE